MSGMILCWKKCKHLLAFSYLLAFANPIMRQQGAYGMVRWGGAIFRATMPLKMFHKLSGVVRFDDKTTRHVRRQTDKLAPIRDIWEKWVERLPLMYNPDLNVTVDECLVAFRGRCSFKQYIPSKPGKYGIKIWATCDAKTSYCWNMQVYTGKPAGAQPERNQGKRVVIGNDTWPARTYCHM